MSKFYQLLSLCGLIALAGATLAGCSKEAAQDPSATKEVNIVEEEVEVPSLDATTPTDPLSELSAADRTAALAQKTCPVSDEPLGSMGTPIKVTVEGRDVFLCCEGCRDSTRSQPRQVPRQARPAAVAIRSTSRIERGPERGAYSTTPLLSYSPTPPLHSIAANSTTTAI